MTRFEALRDRIGKALEAADLDKPGVAELLSELEQFGYASRRTGHRAGYNSGYLAGALAERRQAS